MRSPKSIWKDISLSRRTGIKVTALVIGVTAVVLSAAPLLFLIPAIALPGVTLATAYATAGICAGIFGVMGGIAGAIKLPGFIKEIKHGHEDVTWKNRLGQTIKSTQAQKRDLDIGQETIDHYSYVSRTDVAKSVSEQFKVVADKVAVEKDIKNGDGKFRFALQQTQTKTVTNTTVTPL